VASRFRFDYSLAVLVLMLAFCAGGLYELVRSYPSASRGMLIFARAQKDMFVDAGLVAQSYRVKADPALPGLLRSETVIVATRTSANAGFVGAGVIVGVRDGVLEIVTAKHIIAHPGRRFVIFRDARGLRALRIIPDPRHDLALVYVKAPPHTFYRVARIAKAPFSSGQRFIVLGHPGDFSWYSSPGIAERHLYTTLLFCPSCDRGDSGAGAFDDSGLLRGIVVEKAVMVAPSAKDGSDFRLTAFEVEEPDAVRALVRREERVHAFPS
jgi:hypothetical protein